METPGKTSNGLKQELKQLHQNCLCLTQHKCRASATARQALHDWREKLLHFPSFPAPAAPAHTTKSFPSSCNHNSMIHAFTSVHLLPSAPFPPPSCFTQPLPAVLSFFPPFSPLSHRIPSHSSHPSVPRQVFPAQIKSGLLGITPTPLPSKNNLHIWPLENFISFKVVLTVCHLPGCALNSEVKGLCFY